MAPSKLRLRLHLDLLHILDMEREPVTCGTCGGEGFTVCGPCGGSGGGPDRPLYCPHCGGSGGGDAPCEACEGAKVLHPDTIELGLNCGGCGEFQPLPAPAREVTEFLEDHAGCS